MRSVPPLVLCALLLTLGGCAIGGGSGGSAKGEFVAGADRVCASHVRAVMTLLNQPRVGAPSDQQAAQDEGIYEILDLSVHRMDALGSPPNPDGAAFYGYVRTLKARAAKVGYTREIAIQTGVNKKRQINLYDPDGTRIEVMEAREVDGVPAPSSTAPVPHPSLEK